MEEALRVLVVDDAVTYRKIVSTVLEGLPGIEIVGTAANGKIALEKIPQVKPDLLLLDVEMPEMDGLQLLQRLRAQNSDVGVIMLSAFTAEGAKITVAALEAGAFDFATKPSGGSMQENVEKLRKDLRLKLEAFARSSRIRKILRRPGGVSSPAAAAPGRPGASSAGSAAPVKRSVVAPVRPVGKPAVIALGISTGGPKALTEMLPNLPEDLACPMVLVQHMPAMFTKSLADDLNTRCKLRVEEAQEGQVLRPGLILIAPGGKQMKVESSGTQVVARLTGDPPENSCRPSVDYLFRSIAQVYGGNVVAVIMTGMGNDGSAGCRLLKQRGASVIAQNEATCVVYGMPREPIEEGIADVVAPLEMIAPEITRLAGRGGVRCK